MGDQALSEQDATTLCKWLIDSHLATTTASRTAGRLTETFQEADRRRKMTRLNPLTPKFPLFNPQRMLQQINGVFGWIFTLPVFVVWSIVVAIGCYCVFASWDQVFSSQQQVLDSSNWIWLALVWIGLKVLHEFGHAMACQRFDGEVREAGIVMILAIPLPFVTSPVPGGCVANGGGCLSRRPGCTSKFSSRRSRRSSGASPIRA